MKKYRGIRRYYKNLDRRIKELQLHFEPDLWYNLWHIHLDWTGISNKGLGHRRSHFKKYIELLEKVEEEAKVSGIDYQCWIFIDSKDGTDDALYIQTENPHSEFPVVLSNIEWGIAFPEHGTAI